MSEGKSIGRSMEIFIVTKKITATYIQVCCVPLHGIFIQLPPYVLFTPFPIHLHI